MDSPLDTIVAPATAPNGALAIVRVSGDGAKEILSRLFSPNLQDPMHSHRLYLGKLVYAGDLIDECMAVLMESPHSFTGEDVVEFHSHGGQAVVSAVLDSCIQCGARLAAPGEFSQRAFMNGKLDLAQAEGLCDLISARTHLERKAALQHLSGGVSARTKSIRASLVDCAAEIEAHLDFPEEDIPDISSGRILIELRRSAGEIDSLLRTFQHGRVVREGARVVLAGKPNAGKSSLFNALVGRERAIVTPHPGTTRDTIEATLDIGGIAVTLIDTAGLREATDIIERVGIERSRDAIQSADLIFHVIDSTQPAESSDEISASTGDVPVLRVLNKSDLVKQDAPSATEIAVSTVTREGLEAIEDAIKARFAGTDVSGQVQLTNARHAKCLASAADSLEKAIYGFECKLSGELVMVELRECLLQLAEITGESLGEEILDQVFRKFCLGK